MGAVDVPALLLAVVLSAAITAALALFADEGTHRDLAVAAGIGLVVYAIGMIDLMRETPRETHWATWIFGAALPVAGAAGLLHATRMMKRWQRMPLVFLTTFLLLFGGLLLGSSLVPRLFP
jgi:cytochrome bd-type quinol oxidase subunit 2